MKKLLVGIGALVALATMVFTPVVATQAQEALEAQSR